MFELDARDAAARLATWGSELGEVDLPAIVHVHTPGYNAPEGARIAIGEARVPNVPTLLFQGTRFSGDPTDPDDGGEAGAGDGWTIPRSLLYPASTPKSLQQAADDLAPAGPIRIVHDVDDLEAHEGLVCLPTARGLVDDAWKLAGFLVAARERAGPNAVLYAPGIGRPEHVALAVYAGIDLIDGLEPVLAALEGQLFATDGTVPVETVDEVLVPTPAALEASEDGWTRDRLVAHNRAVLDAEIARVRHAISQGRLRELVEARVRASPTLVATLRRLDLEHGQFFEQRAPIVRDGTLPIVSRRSLTRPEITRWLDRLATRYTAPPSAEVLVVLPCSARKPYEDSATHRRIRPAINKHGKGRVHVATLTSPLGAVPEELELTYPAAHYDVPVTGDWNETEIDIIQRAFTALHKNGGYDDVILHLSMDEADIVEPVLPDAQRTVEVGQRPTDKAATEALGERVQAATSGLEAVSRSRVFFEHMQRRVDWQFGHGIHETLMADTRVRGKYPWLKVFDADDTQLFMLQPDRGAALPLTFEGGQRLFGETDAYTVWIDDFEPKGSVFGVGVTGASEAIRIGDEVLVVHEDELRAVGRASAPGPEMAAMTSGSAVEVRHHA